MNYTPLMGIALPEHDWVPAPTYILRRAAILDWMKTLPSGRVVEFGCGPGALLHDLSRMGFHGAGVEASSRSIHLSKIIHAGSTAFAVQGHADCLRPQDADYLLAFEVLEHIEHDAEALTSWLRYLRPGGLVLISLPAHRGHWNVTDTQAGHFRRYDRKDVIDLIEGSGLQILRIGTYGWPFSRLFEILRLRAAQVRMRRQGLDLRTTVHGNIDLTYASGYDRRLESRLFPYYSSWPGRVVFWLAAQIQRMFYDTDLGISYLVLAKKSDAPSSD